MKISLYRIIRLATDPSWERDPEWWKGGDKLPEKPPFLQDAVESILEYRELERKAREEFIQRRSEMNVDLSQVDIGLPKEILDDYQEDTSVYDILYWEAEDHPDIIYPIVLENPQIIKDPS